MAVSAMNGVKLSLVVTVDIESNQIKSLQITFIVTSPQHKCLGE